MDRDSLISHLASSEGLAWRTSPQRDAPPNTKMVAWTLAATVITSPGSPTLCLGITSTGHWVYFSQAQGTVFDFEAADYYWPAFPLLEKSHHDVTEMLIAEFGKHGINQAWIDYFPFQNIVAAALESGSKYWPDLALGWVPSLGPSQRIVAALQRLLQRGRTQPQRHRAKKLLKTTSTRD